MKALGLIVFSTLVCLNIAFGQNNFPNTGNVGIGTTTPNQQLNINQLAGSQKGLLLSGDEYYQSGNNSTSGIILVLGVNRPGNRQLWVGDNTYLGSKSYGFLRMCIGSGIMPTFDCVSGDGNVHLPFNIGDFDTNIGIGFNSNNQTPASKITVNGNLAIGNGYLGIAAPANGAIIQGNVLIGKTTPSASNYMLDVNGNVRSNSVVVNTTGADFVFEPTYTLPNLNDVKAYIEKNHHLPEIPSAKEMQTNGLNVGENQTKLLQKVEELTLYLIEQNKRIEKLESQLKNNKNEN